MQVSEIIEQKGDRVISVSPGTSVRDVAETLRQERIGAAVVQGADSGVAGIISERDIVGAISEHGESALAMPASDLMSRAVVTCTRQSSTEDLMKQMSSSRIRHLPVVEDGALLGIVSVSDVVKCVLSELKWRNEVLSEQVVAAATWSTDDD